MSDRAGWISKADVIIGFENLSASEKAYRLSQNVWQNPKYEGVREANRSYGIRYVVKIAKDEYEFYCAEDVWAFELVADRAYCDYENFIQELDDGLCWESGDVIIQIKKSEG